MYTKAYIGFDCLLFVLNSEQVTFTKYVLTLIKGNELMFECIHLMDTIQTYVGFSLRFSYIILFRAKTAIKMSYLINLDISFL